MSGNLIGCMRGSWWRGVPSHFPPAFVFSAHAIAGNCNAMAWGVSPGRINRCGPALYVSRFYSCQQSSERGMIVLCSAVAMTPVRSSLVPA